MVAGGPVIELAMIVRNGGAGLARAVLSAQPVVDRVVIGDTGSTDNSVAIAQSLGAHLFTVAWEEDFSKARNAVLQACEAGLNLFLLPLFVTVGRLFCFGMT